MSVLSEETMAGLPSIFFSCKLHECIDYAWGCDIEKSVVSVEIFSGVDVKNPGDLWINRHWNSKTFTVSEAILCSIGFIMQKLMMKQNYEESVCTIIFLYLRQSNSISGNLSHS